MKKTLFFALAIFFLNVVSYSQESGNRIYGNSQNKRVPPTNSGNLLSENAEQFSIEASVLLNMKPDSFVAVYGIAQEGKTSEESNEKANRQIDAFIKDIVSLGIDRSTLYVDFIAQNKAYDYQIKGDVAEQYLAGFETKKTVAIPYKTKEMSEKILAAAARSGIHDLIKVDYIVSDFDSVRDKLFEEAAKIIRDKEARYKKTFGMAIKPISLAVEKYDAFYPAERYEGYQAYESGSTRNSDYRNARSVITLRKSATFFYEPLSEGKFDKTINGSGTEPTVQFTLYTRYLYKIL